MDYGNSKINLIYEYKKKTTKSTLQETMKKHTDFSPNYKKCTNLSKVGNTFGILPLV